MSQKKTPKKIESNIKAFNKEELITGNLNTAWYRVTFSQTKVATTEDPNQFKYVDDPKRPLNFLLEIGKSILKLNFEDMLKLKNIMKEESKLFNRLLQDERAKRKDDGDFTD